MNLKNKCQPITLCKFQPGFGGKFMYFITQNILQYVENKSNASGPKTCTCPLCVMLAARQLATIIMKIFKSVHIRIYLSKYETGEFFDFN